MKKVTLSGGRGWLEEAAAESLARVDKARGRVQQITEAGRSYARQAWHYARYRAGIGPLALSPTVPSVHQKGRAIDTDDRAWLRAHPGYGWIFNVPSEPWHAEYAPERDIALAQTLLNELGAKLAVDGVNGPATSKALRAAQGKHGVKVDGVWGPSSLKALTYAVAGKRAADAAAKVKPKPKPSTRPTLRRGMKGTHVLALQRKLKTVYPLYAGKLKLDSIFGPAVEAAVREFQRRAGLVVDGIVGPATWKRLGL